MKTKFDRVVFSNRWKKKKIHRNSDWVIFGIQRFVFSPKEYEWRLCLFGFDIRFWFEKVK